MATLGPREVVTSTVVNDRNQGAILTVTVALSITCAFLFLAIRLLIRRPWRSLFGKDDTTITIATVVLLVQAIVTLQAVNEGLGTRNADLSGRAISAVEKLIYITDLLWVIAVYLSKFAVSLFFARLSDLPAHRKGCYGISIACGVCCFVSILVLAIQHPTSSISSGRLTRWIVTEALSCLVDVAIIAFTVFLIMRLQMKQWMKIKIVSAFGLRFILIPLAVLHLFSFAKHESNLFGFVIPEIYLQAELCYNIISATIPCLGMFLERASPHFLGGQNYIDPTTSAMAMSKNGNSYHMSNLSSRGRNEEKAIKLTGKRHGESMAQASRGGGGDGTSVASDSSERAIVVRQTVNVQYAPASSL